MKQKTHTKKWNAPGFMAMRESLERAARRIRAWEAEPEPARPKPARPKAAANAKAKAARAKARQTADTAKAWAIVAAWAKENPTPKNWGDAVSLIKQQRGISGSEAGRIVLDKWPHLHPANRRGRGRIT